MKGISTTYDTKLISDKILPTLLEQKEQNYIILKTIWINQGKTPKNTRYREEGG